LIAIEKEMNVDADTTSPAACQSPIHQHGRHYTETPISNQPSFKLSMAHCNSTNFNWSGMMVKINFNQIFYQKSKIKIKAKSRNS
jgi:hypothetical protein